MIAFNGLSSQIIRLPNVPIVRGRETITAGYWFLANTTPDALESYWRHDRLFTPSQWETSIGQLRPVVWDSSNTFLNVVPAQAWSPFTLATWFFCCMQYNRRGLRAWSYVPGGAVTQGGGTVAFTSIVTRAPSPVLPMVIGGTESNGERASSGKFLAELTILSRSIPEAAIPLLAHEPQRFADSLLFYAPLRNADARTIPVNGRAFEFQYGTQSRELLSERGHPPVEKWRTGIRVFVPSTYAPRIASADTLRVSAMQSGSTLRVRMG